MLNELIRFVVVIRTDRELFGCNRSDYTSQSGYTKMKQSVRGERSAYHHSTVLALFTIAQPQPLVFPQLSHLAQAPLRTSFNA